MHRKNNTTLEDFDEIELHEFNKKQQYEAIATGQKISSAVKFIEALDLAAIYIMFLQKFLLQFYLEIGKYFMLPIAIAAGLIETVLAWRQVYLDGGESQSIIRAVLETVATTAITIAVVGALAASTLFALATPIIFTVNAAAKTLYHAGTSAYYTYKSFTSPEPEKQKEYLTIAKVQGVVAAVGVIATIAVACVFLLGKTVVAGLGVAAGLLAAGLSLYMGIKAFSENNRPAKPLATQEIIEEEDTDQENDLKPFPTSSIFKGLEITSENAGNTSGINEQNTSTNIVTINMETTKPVPTPTLENPDLDFIQSASPGF